MQYTVFLGFRYASTYEYIEKTIIFIKPLHMEALAMKIILLMENWN